MKAKHIMLVLGMTMILTFTGCGSSKPVVEVTPTPAATPIPTEVPVTVTPVPTSTPAPKVIGVKTSQAKYIYMTNKLEDDIREIYLMTSGGDDWGKNLIPAEASVKHLNRYRCSILRMTQLFLQIVQMNQQIQQLQLYMI